MTSRDFCYWLQGFFEIQQSGLPERCSEQLVGTKLNEREVACIKKHLAMVFKYEIDPSCGDKPQQDALNEIHNSTSLLSPPKIRC